MKNAISNGDNTPFGAYFCEYMIGKQHSE